MKIQGTLKRFGGAGIKLKDRIISVIKLILIIVIGYLGCQLVYMLFDIVLNGLFMDWFEGHFLTTSLMIDPYTQENVYVRNLDFSVLGHGVSGMCMARRIVFGVSL